jgi:hypothetical protein
MKRSGSHRSKKRQWSSAVLFLALFFPATGKADLIWQTTVTLTNNSGGQVWDLEANFSGVANSMFDGNLIKPPGTATVDADSAKITLNFNPAIANGKDIKFTFKNTASPDVAFEFGNWTDMNGGVIKAVDITRDNVVATTVALPEPNSAFVASLGGLAVGIVLRRHRHRRLQVGRRYEYATHFNKAFADLAKLIDETVKDTKMDVTLHLNFGGDRKRTDEIKDAETNGRNSLFEKW